MIERYIGFAGALGYTNVEQVLDFGCGDGATVREFCRAGYDAYGCDVTGEETERLRLIRDPYRLPFDDASFDFIVSERVLEHVQDYAPVFQELRRVLRRGGLSLHFYPPKWTPIEPHTFIPLGTVIQSRAWCQLWALAGIRNQFQQGLSATQTVEKNRPYLLNHTNYPSRTRMLEMAGQHFETARYVEREYLRFRSGRCPAWGSRAYSGLRSRVLLLA